MKFEYTRNIDQYVTKCNNSLKNKTLGVKYLKTIIVKMYK